MSGGQRAVAQLGSALDWGSGELGRRSSTKTKQRDVAQLGSALDWGSRGRRFKSCHPDKKAQVRACFSPGLRRFPGWSLAGPLARSARSGHRRSGPVPLGVVARGVHQKVPEQLSPELRYLTVRMVHDSQAREVGPARSRIVRPPRGAVSAMRRCGSGAPPAGPIEPASCHGSAA